MVRICALHPPAARPGGSGVRTRGCRWTDGPLQTARGHYWGSRAQMRDAHATNVSKRVEWSAFAHCTHRPRAPVAAASARGEEKGSPGTLPHAAAATRATAPMCAMRTPIKCRKVSNCPHLHIALTGRAPGWQRRPHARVEEHQLVLWNSSWPLRGPPHPCARCTHR